LAQTTQTLPVLRVAIISRTVFYAPLWAAQAQHLFRDLGLSAGQTMTLDTTDNGQIVLAKKRKYILAELIAQCDPKAPPPADLALWDSAKPVGQEVW
jgi:antitoxin ChpS